MSLPTVDDLKAYLNETGTANDGEMQDMLDAAVNVAESIVGALNSNTVTETHYGLNTDMIVLRQFPAASVTSITGRLFPGVVPTSYLTTDYALDTDTGVLRLTTGFHFIGDFTVTYAVGGAVVPPAISLAILIVAGHLWLTQRSGGSVRPSFPGDSNNADTTPSPGYLIPYRAEELLKPYAQHHVA